MSEPIDTDAVREEWDHEGPYGPEPAAMTIVALCDEVDHWKKAWRAAKDDATVEYDRMKDEVDRLRAALFHIKALSPHTTVRDAMSIADVALRAPGGES